MLRGNIMMVVNITCYILCKHRNYPCDCYKREYSFPILQMRKLSNAEIKELDPKFH